MLEFIVFSRAHQVLNEMFERAFTRVLGQLTYVERGRQLSTMGGENG